MSSRTLKNIKGKTESDLVSLKDSYYRTINELEKLINSTEGLSIPDINNILTPLGLYIKDFGFDFWTDYKLNGDKVKPIAKIEGGGSVCRVNETEVDRDVLLGVVDQISYDLQANIDKINVELGYINKDVISELNNYRTLVKDNRLGIFGRLGVFSQLENILLEHTNKTLKDYGVDYISIDYLTNRLDKALLIDYNENVQSIEDKELFFEVAELYLTLKDQPRYEEGTYATDEFFVEYKDGKKILKEITKDDYINVIEQSTKEIEKELK